MVSQDKYMDLNNNFVTLQIENERLKSQLAEADRRNKEYQEKIRLLERTSVDKLETALPQTYFENVANEDLKAKYDELKLRYDSLVEQNAQLVRKNNESANKIKQLETERENRMGDLYCKYDDLQAEYDELKETKEDYYEQIKDWQERHNNDCITINQLNVTIDTLVDKYHKLRKIHGLV